MSDLISREATIAAIEGLNQGTSMVRAKQSITDRAVAAVRALPSAPAVKVKPLVWIERADIIGLHNAKGADWYWYNVRQEASNAFTYEGQPSNMPDRIRVKCDTLEAAKAAAQSDYEARILSALEGGDA